MKTAMGTNSSTVTAAIKEIIDGTSQGDTTLRTTAADSTQRTIVRDAQNGGFLRKVKDGLIGSTAQKIISNIDFSRSISVIIKIQLIKHKYKNTHVLS